MRYQLPHSGISYESQSAEPATISTNPGVAKWAVNAEDCYIGWTTNSAGCGMCIRTCTINEPEGWLHDATCVLIGVKSGSLDNILLKLDDASGYGKEFTLEEFWQRDNYVHVKG